MAIVAPGVVPVPAAPAVPQIDIAKLAHTTGFQNNCALNALVHCIKQNLNNIPDATVTSLHQNLLKYYGLPASFTVADLINVLNSINDPVRLEVFLAPVLRNMLLNPELHNNSRTLDGDDICELANRFGIQLRTFSQQGGTSHDNLKYLLDNTNRRQNPAAAKNPVIAIPPLNLWYSNGHWEFENPGDGQRNAHNAHYNSQHSMWGNKYRYDAGQHLQKLKQDIRDELLKPGRNLNQMFDRFEASVPLISATASGADANRASSNRATEQNTMAIQQGITMLGSLFGGRGNGGFSGLGGFISSIFQLFSVFQKLGKIFNPDGPLSDDEIEGDPSAESFADSVAELAEQGRAGARAAKKLNEAWRKTPNSDAVWQQLNHSRERCGLVDARPQQSAAPSPAPSSQAQQLQQLMQQLGHGGGPAPAPAPHAAAPAPPLLLGAHGAHAAAHAAGAGVPPVLGAAAAVPGVHLGP